MSRKWNISTIRLYSVIHVGSRWKMQDRRQIIIQRIQKHNPEKVNKTQQNKITLVQSPFTTLGQETRWTYCRTLRSPHGARKVVKRR